MRYHWHGGRGGGWGWVLPGITMLLFALVLVALLVLLWRVLARGGGRGGGPPAPHWGSAPASGAEQLLAERLARGEIEVDEYRMRLAALREGSGPPG
ncbi:SHOCT domain-containing protein [Kitasatospora sp. NPDC059571]|uniref:SHOCT domain-containing protein n=1 Tax=Kitasatospora sp. NPDC059571 TaxID=3346871 RepID=UPI00367623DB